MADQDEDPGAAKTADAAIGQDQRERDGESRNRDRQRDDFLDNARKAAAARMQRVSRGYPNDERDEQCRERDLERTADGVGVERPDLADPVQGDTRPDAAKIIHGDTRDHGQDRRNDQEGRHKKGEGKLQAEQDACFRHVYPAAATVAPAKLRASARMAQATNPSPTESAAAMAIFAPSVNS